SLPQNKVSLTKIKSALISVFHKDNLEPIIRKLHELNVELYSTGGTEAFIKKLDIPVNAVEDLTDYPSILGGRVKTLHPKVFGGILSRREIDEDIAQLETYEIPPIDLVIVDLYPFEETLASGASEQDIIEKIDIGGISLIRAAAKNYKDVTIVPGMQFYPDLLEILEEGNGETQLKDRKRFAAAAFDISSHYDAAIYGFFSDDQKSASLKVSESEFLPLRYGENPHQRGRFYGDLSDVFDQLHGKELSYNNLLDVDAAVLLMNEFLDSQPTFAIMKHNNACGLATRSSIKQAYTAALAGDPVSAFGGILISNVEIDRETADEINTLFCEVVIAPSYSDEALDVLKSKKNRIILVQKENDFPSVILRSAVNGILWQDRDEKTDESAGFKTATKKSPDEKQIADLEFASKICKHTKSNTIVLAKDGQLLASGTGQTSRVDALNQAISKARHFDFDLEGCVMASDAFFPFPDCVEIADKAGIKAVIQPGGSIKDQLSIDYCNENGLSMVFTGTRHFKH
ncbi:MAG TPA: bifunctional phosphoribosylaminoimidazolecarboxamide formyltransferase/IMP cyclohydrolase, partial [Cryomorphaceae bacterium]|nr:bifunctional phosphoribosylaminoimidazolecarboxamide formyltransferase/IMP cyclohydrolase [Cryomorphaceae bacterium]